MTQKIIHKTKEIKITITNGLQKKDSVVEIERGKEKLIFENNGEG